MQLTFVILFDDATFASKCMRLEEILKQKSKDYKLLFINNLNDLKLQEQLYNKINAFDIKNRPLIIDNYNTSILMHAYNNAIKLISTPYCYFVSANNKIKSNFVSVINDIFEQKGNKKQSFDIISFLIEFNSSFSSAYFWPKNMPEKSLVQSYKILYAYIDPYLSTKIWNINFLRHNKLKFDVETRQDYYFIYKALSSAHNFYFLSECLISKMYNQSSNRLSWISLYDQWVNIINFLKLNRKFELYYQELEFAYLRFYYFFVWHIAYNNDFPQEQFTDLNACFFKLLNSNFNNKALNIYLNMSDNVINTYIKKILEAKVSFSLQTFIDFATQYKIINN